MLLVLLPMLSAVGAGAAEDAAAEAATGDVAASLAAAATDGAPDVVAT